MIEKAVYQILTGAAPVMAVVAGRIFPRVKTGTGPAPYIVYTEITNNPTVDISRAEGRETSTFQVDIYDPDPSDAGALAALVRAALHRYCGAAGGMAIEYILMQSRRPGYDREAGLHRVTLEFIAKHN
jgi:hypothetical protein